MLEWRARWAEPWGLFSTAPLARIENHLTGPPLTWHDPDRGGLARPNSDRSNLSDKKR